MTDVAVMPRVSAGIKVVLLDVAKGIHEKDKDLSLKGPCYGISLFYRGQCIPLYRSGSDPLVRALSGCVPVQESMDCANNVTRCSSKFITVD